jgi:hypothetical protein
LKELNLPSYSFRITGDAGAQMIFDPIRKKYVQLTDEEWVRQNFAQYLIHEGNYPAGLMRIEGWFRLYAVKKRIDILVHDRTGKPVLMVECKKPEIALDDAVMEQLTTYNLQFKVPYLVITNGMSNRAYKMDYEANRWDELTVIPQFDDLLK